MLQAQFRDWVFLFVHLPAMPGCSRQYVTCSCSNPDYHPPDAILLGLAGAVANVANLPCLAGGGGWQEGNVNYSNVSCELFN